MKASVELEDIEMKGVVVWMETGRFKPARWEELIVP